MRAPTHARPRLEPAPRERLARLASLVRLALDVCLVCLVCLGCLVCLVCLGALACEPAAPLASDDSCAPCHTLRAEQHRGTAHANSAPGSAVLQALLPRVERSWGETARARCQSCHAPAGMGHVACVSCHAAVGNTAPRDGRLVWNAAAGLAAMHEGASPGGAHGVRDGAFLRSSELCLSCHEVTGPALFVEPTGGEHEAYRASGGEHACVDCHMPLEGGGRSHRIVGLRPPELDPATGAPSPAALASYAADVTALVGDALTLEVARDGDELEISLTNVGAGHAVPTGVALLRSIGVGVLVTDGSAAPLLSLGMPQGDARPEGPLELGSLLTEAGQPVADPTRAEHVLSRALAPRERRSVRVTLPPSALPRTARVALYARAYTSELLEALELPPRAAPLVLVDERTLHD